VTRRHCLLLALLLLGGARAGAQPTATTPVAPESDLTVTLVTFGQGQEVFERFGHDALWIHDARAGTDVAYHWGLFSFNEPGFLTRFLTGDTNYWMGGEDALGMIAVYRQLGRAITLQQLALTPAQALALRDFVQWNARPENRFYRYDYFRDNCATRLRDALDRALGGALRRATDSVRTNLTYRRESLRLTDGDVPVQAGIDIALGRPADARLSEWESFFIPMRLRDAVRGIRVAGPSGGTVPLVARERLLAPAPDAPHLVEARRPPRLAGRYLLAGLLLAAVVAGLRIMMLSRRSAAWGLALLGAGWSLLCGLLGVVLLLAWFATRHVFWAHNENVLLLSPVSLLLVVLAPASLLRGRAARGARMVAALVVALGLVALLLAVVPGGQENRPIVALFLPVHLALAWALALPRRSPAPAGP
jgi:hypothetical protein